jgi:hypothetical protein
MQRKIKHIQQDRLNSLAWKFIASFVVAALSVPTLVGTIIFVAQNKSLTPETSHNTLGLLAASIIIGVPAVISASRAWCEASRISNIDTPMSL